MRFLVSTSSRQAPPPEMAPMMMMAMRAWLAEHRASGAMEEVWGFAGVPGGGGIFNVESLDELDAAMATFPFAQYSNIEVHGLVDIDAALDRAEAHMIRVMEAIAAMAEAVMEE